MIVMAGGIDLHSHIGGGKMNLFAPAAAGGSPRRCRARSTLTPDARVQTAATCALPSRGAVHARHASATGYRYAEMGYTAAFEPAMMPSNARHTHLEMGDTPIIDHGAYVMLGNDELFLQMLAAARRLRAPARLRRLDDQREQGARRERW